MRKTDRKLDDFIQEAENSYSETVSDATTVYDAAGLKNNDYAGLFSGEEDTDAVFASEDDSVLLPSELAEQEVPKKKGNPIARFFKWIGSWKIGVKILVLVLILALMSGGVMAMTAIKEVEDAVKIMNAGAEIPDSYDLGITPVDGFINILLLGTDARQMSGDEPTRADMVMIASINVETHEVTLTSIYRDTYLKLGDTSTYDKITHAYFYGGPEMTIKTVNQALDLNIQNYAVVNFKVVADVVDAIGGIDINVEDYEIDEMNACIRENALVLTASDDTEYITSSGLQTLNGFQALAYGRMRNGVGDDFKRTERMRIVATTAFDKMKTMKFSALKKVIKAIAPSVKTNLKITDMLALGKDITKYTINAGAGFPYSASAGNYYNVSYVFPTDLAGDVTRLHNEVFGQAGYVTSSMVDEISYTAYSRYAGREATNSSDEEVTE
jgi:LCP family protein required for cell wall assembly